MSGSGMKHCLTSCIAVLLASCTGGNQGQDTTTDTVEDQFPGDGTYPGCEPEDQDVDVFVGFSFDLDPPGGEDVNYTSTCTVEGIGIGGDTTIVVLECQATGGGVEGHTFSLSTRPAEPLDLNEGETVEVNYSAWWLIVNRIEWFIIRDSSEEVVVAVTDGALIHPEEPEWYSPLEVSVAEGLCPRLEDVYDCSDIERQAIDVRYGDDEVRVFDGSYGAMGDSPPSYVTIVDLALRYLEPYTCTDQPAFRQKLAIIRRR